MSHTPTGTVLVEILTFDGCPNAEPAINTLEQAAAGLRLETDLHLIDVPNPQAADRMRFLGSPTIRVEGQDVEPGADDRDQFVLACRVYQTKQGASGVPPHAWISEALQRAADASV